MSDAIPLYQRLGADTIQQFEQAAAWRFREAADYRPKRPLISVYLFGYSVEARLQAAVYRLSGIGVTDSVDARTRQRFMAEARQLHLMTSEPHDLLGWCRYLGLVRKRTQHGFAARISAELLSHGQRLYRNWRPTLRYRTLAIEGEELREVFEAAAWFRENYNLLWS